jgi:hypothetical protein
MNYAEELFVKEYKELLKKHGVELVVELGVYEEGEGYIPIFRQSGKYCNIHYTPNYTELRTGRQCMGG